MHFLYTAQFNVQANASASKISRKEIEVFYGITSVMYSETYDIIFMYNTKK